MVRQSSARVVALNEIKDNGKVFLRICGSDPARILGVAAEEAENVRHCESLWLFQHGCRGSAPMWVKRTAAREPFTLREKLATGWPQSIDEGSG